MQDTRRKILEILQEQGQATVGQLSQVLDLTPVTVRHHLEVLHEEGLVDSPQRLQRSGPGRPQHVYRLTEAASAYFPNNYGGLVELLLEEVREQISPSALEGLMHGVAQRLAERAPAVSQAERPQEIMDSLVRFLNEQGYAAHWEQDDGGDYLLHTRNCPYKRVAQGHDEVCAIGVDLVERLAGAVPQRVSHIAAGDNICTYLLRFDDAERLV